MILEFGGRDALIASGAIVIASDTPFVAAGTGAIALAGVASMSFSVTGSMEPPANMLAGARMRPRRNVEPDLEVLHVRVRVSGGGRATVHAHRVSEQAPPDEQTFSLLLMAA